MSINSLELLWFSHTWLIIMPDLFRKKWYTGVNTEHLMWIMSLHVCNCVSAYLCANIWDLLPTESQRPTTQSSPKWKSLSFVLSLSKVEKYRLAWQKASWHEFITRGNKHYSKKRTHYRTSGDSTYMHWSQGWCYRELLFILERTQTLDGACQGATSSQYFL